jgi:multidrug efflux pump subunit AcrB
MQELHWYDKVETFTRPGQLVMVVSFLDKMPSSLLQEQFYQARKKLGDMASVLPQGVLGPYVNDEFSNVAFAVYAVRAKDMAPRELTREAESLRQRLLHVPGVKKIDIMGERPERIFVDFSNARLANLGISPRDVFGALARQNAITPAGSIDTSGPQVQVRLDGAYNDLQTIADTPIAAGGRSFRLSDVAEVKRGYEDPASFLIRHNGEPAMALSLVMKEGWNGLDLGRALDAEETKISATLPVGISFSKITDQAVNIRSAIDEFMEKFFVALAVVMLVSLISLGWRVGVVVAAAVPLTLAAVFVIMLFTGRVFDRITLGALIIALGLLVDDAIIAIEVMVVKLEEGYDRIKAAAYAGAIPRRRCCRAPWSPSSGSLRSASLSPAPANMPATFSGSSASLLSRPGWWRWCSRPISAWCCCQISSRCRAAMPRSTRHRATASCERW